MSDATPGPGAIVRAQRETRGLTRQRNLGAAAATGEVVLFLDDDATVRPNTFQSLQTAFRDPSVVGATGRVVGDRSRIVNRESRLRRCLPGGGRECGARCTRTHRTCDANSG